MIINYDRSDFVTFARLWLAYKADETNIMPRAEIVKRVGRLRRKTGNVAIFPKISSASLLLKKVPLTASVILISDRTMFSSMRHIQEGIDAADKYSRTVQSLSDSYIRLDRLRESRVKLSEEIVNLRIAVDKLISPSSR